MSYNAADRKQVRAAEKLAKLADQQRRDHVNLVMSTEPGRRYTHDRLVSAHIFATSFSEDALLMAFKEGERNQGLQLLNDIMSTCPEQYVQMMVESNARSSAAERSREPNPDWGDQGPGGADDPDSGSEIPGSQLDA